MMISEVAVATLAFQTLCPSCGVSWKAVDDMLHTPVTHPDRYQALTVISNCPVCRIKFSKELKEV